MGQRSLFLCYPSLLFQSLCKYTHRGTRPKTILYFAASPARRITDHVVSVDTKQLIYDVFIVPRTRRNDSADGSGCFARTIKCSESNTSSNELAVVGVFTW